MEDILERYQREFKNIDGFFVEEAQVTWDFLLSQQNAMGIRGDFVEIGVFHGKSALLGAMYFGASETVILVDLNDISATAEKVSALAKVVPKSFIGRSYQFRFADLSRSHAGKVRWFHIDGDHSGFSTWNDLKIAADMISDRGIICIDDFYNMRYPQLMAAVYRFLFANPNFKMFLIGGCKAYICLADTYSLWEGVVRKSLVAALRARGFEVSISKTSYAHDFGCFSVGPRQNDRDLIGRDENSDDVVF